MSRIWMSHVTHIWMSHVTHMKESCHTYEWVMSHIWMSHVTHTNWQCHAAHLNEVYVKWLTHSQISSGIIPVTVTWPMWHESCDMTHVTWLLWHDAYDMTHAFAWHDSYIFVKRLTHICDMLIRTCDMPYLWRAHLRVLTHSCVWHDSSIFLQISLDVWCDSCDSCDMTYVILLPHLHDTTHSYMCNNSLIYATCLFICVPWLIHDARICVCWFIHMCDMTHYYVWHDSFICVTWLIIMCDMTHSYVWHVLIMCVTWLNHMFDVTHSHAWCDSCDMMHTSA